MKEPNEAMFTITAQDKHGIYHKGRIEIDRGVYNKTAELFKNLGTTIEDMTVGFLKYCVIPKNLPLLKAYLGIENAPAEAGAQMELHHRIFKQVFDIATKNTG